MNVKNVVLRVSVVISNHDPETRAFPIASWVRWKVSKGGYPALHLKTLNNNYTRFSKENQVKITIEQTIENT